MKPLAVGLLISLALLFSPAAVLAQSGLTAEQALAQELESLRPQLPITSPNGVVHFHAFLHGKTVYHFYLIPVPFERMTQAQIGHLQNTMQQDVLKAGCAVPNLQTIMRAGGTYRFQYFSADFHFLTEVEMNQALCQALAPQ